MASPWAKIQPPTDSINFLDITSEQLARNLQDKELEQGTSVTPHCQNESENEINEITDTVDDQVIAYMLQAQFNTEYDDMLKRTEEKLNRNSKVNISYSNYRTSQLEEQKETNINVNDNDSDIDRFVSIEKEYASIPRCGYKKKGEGSQIVTKHDMLMTSRINACRVLKFPPGIHTGDTGGFDLKLNNKVFNSLRAHSYAQYSREKAKTRPHQK